MSYAETEVPPLMGPGHDKFHECTLRELPVGVAR